MKQEKSGDDTAAGIGQRMELETLYAGYQELVTELGRQRELEYPHRSFQDFRDWYMSLDEQTRGAYGARFSKNFADLLDESKCRVAQVVKAYGYPLDPMK